jgi:hypothetical protein
VGPCVYANPTLHFAFVYNYADNTTTEDSVSVSLGVLVDLCECWQPLCQLHVRSVNISQRQVP